MEFIKAAGKQAQDSSYHLSVELELKSFSMLSNGICKYNENEYNVFIKQKGWLAHIKNLSKKQLQRQIDYQKHKRHTDANRKLLNNKTASH